MGQRARTVGTWALAVLLISGCGGPARSPADGGTTHPGPGTPDGPSFDEVVAAVEDRVAVYDGIATGVIALVRVGDETRVVTQGLAQARGRRPMKADQTFPIASITKPMVATVVLQLVDEGRIALDDDVRRLLPELRAAPRPISVEDLLSHRSGLPSDASHADLRRHGTDDTAALVDAAARRGLDFAPGTRGRYSNLGFAALGLLVERELGEPLGDALDEHVFRPAGMHQASLGGAPDVQGYVDGRPVRNYYLDYLPGAGSVVTTAPDLDRFFQSLWAGDLVPEDVVADMQTSRGAVLVDVDFSLDYGLGLMHIKLSCGVAIGHSGRIGGFATEAWTLEDSDRSVVVAVNDQDAGDIARGIVQTALCEG